MVKGQCWHTVVHALEISSIARPVPARERDVDRFLYGSLKNRRRASYQPKSNHSCPCINVDREIVPRSAIEIAQPLLDCFKTIDYLSAVVDNRERWLSPVIVVAKYYNLCQLRFSAGTLFLARIAVRKVCR